MAKRMKYSLGLGLVVLAGLTFGSSVHATTCGEVRAAGSCEGNTTLLYCQNDVLVRVECPSGELCVLDDAHFQGAAGCVAASLAGCGDVNESGACDAKDTLVFCDAREVKKRTCPVGTSCGWVEEEGWFDCVSNHLSRDQPFAQTPEAEPPTEPGPDGIPTEEPAQPATDSGAAQAPSVQAGGAPAAGEYQAAGSGCGAGSGGANVAILLALTVMTWRRLRGGQSVSDTL